MKTCFLFPGQGAQYPGMGKDLWESSSAVKDLFKLASDSTGINTEKLLFEGTEEELKKTDNTQIAITLVNLAVSAVLDSKRIKSDGTAGFSLGEYAALAEAGIISREEIFKLVQFRGEVMDKCVAKLTSESAGNAPGMAAVMGLDFDGIAAALKKAGIKDVFPANYNSSSQIVVGGTGPGLDAAEPVLKEAGARRFIKLKVAGPFHTPLMEFARKSFEDGIGRFSFHDPKKPIYSNVTGKLITSGAQARELCVKQLISPVLWVAEEQQLLADKFERFIETGPGTVLTGLWKTVTDNPPCIPAGTLDQIQAIK